MIQLHDGPHAHSKSSTWDVMSICTTPLASVKLYSALETLLFQVGPETFPESPASIGPTIDGCSCKHVLVRLVEKRISPSRWV